MKDPRLTPEDWMYAGSTKLETFRLKDVAKDNSYEIVVVPRAAKGAAQATKYGTRSIVTPLGKYEQPTDPSNVSGGYVGDSVSLCWDKAADKDIDFYEIREGGSFWGGRTVAYSVDNSVTFGRHSKSSVTYWIRAKNKTGQWSDFSASCPIAAYTATLVITGEADCQDDWDASGLREGFANSGTYLESSSATATYTTSALVVAKDTYIPLIKCGSRVIPIDQTLEYSQWLLNSNYAKRRFLSELTTSSLEGMEARDLSFIDRHDYTLSHVYANIGTLEKSTDLLSTVSVIVQIRSSGNGGINWTAWEPYCPIVTTNINAIQAKVDITTQSSSILPIWIESFEIALVKTATSHGYANPMTTDGDMIYQGGGVPTRLPNSTNDYVLKLTAGVPTWAPIAKAIDTEGASLSIVTGAGPGAGPQYSLNRVTEGTTTEAALSVSSTGTSGVYLDRANSTSAGALVAVGQDGTVVKSVSGVQYWLGAVDVSATAPSAVTGRLWLNTGSAASGGATTGYINTSSTSDISVTLSNSHTIVLVDASNGNVTINLPPVATYGNKFFQVKKIDATSNTVTLDPNGAELIEFASTATILVQGESVKITCDSLAYYIL